jgi:DNA-binding sugar fermentation-stimulating protein
MVFNCEAGDAAADTTVRRVCECATRLQVGVHSALANKLARAILDAHALPQLQGYTEVVPEVQIASFMPSSRKRRLGEKKVPKSRIDFQLNHEDGTFTFVEVKSVTYTQQSAHSLTACQRAH